MEEERGEAKDKWVVPLMKYAYQKMVDSIIRVRFLCFASVTTSITMFESKKNTQNFKRRSVKHTITRSLRRITGPFFAFFT